MKLTLNKKSHTEISFCVCQDPKNTLLIGPQRENRKFDIQKNLTYFIKIYIFMIFKKRCIGVPGCQKNGFESLWSDPEGVYEQYTFS